MHSLTAYLSFNGNCREAMTFYNSCLGGSLSFQTLYESPKAVDRPLRNCIVSATLKRDELVLVGTDLLPEEWKRGNSISLLLTCANEVEMKHCYKQLSMGGKQMQLPQCNEEGAWFGTLIDQFENEWLLHCVEQLIEK